MQQLLNSVKTVKQCHNQLKQIFLKGKVAEPCVSSQYLIAHALGEKTLYRVNPSTEISEPQLEKIIKFAIKRLTGQPIQYILSEWDFRHLVLQMKQPVFIPRPETEELVGHILEDATTCSASKFLEVGCGSGAIALSLLYEMKQLKGVAIDINEDACELTMHNAKSYGLEDRLQVFNTDIKGFSHRWKAKEKFDILVSNPPYISTADMKILESSVKDFEDHRALHGGVDGLDIVNTIVREAPALLVNNGNIWLEVDSYHPDIIEEGISQSVQFSYVKSMKDFRNMPRFCHFQCKKCEE